MERAHTVVLNILSYWILVFNLCIKGAFSRKRFIVCVSRYFTPLPCIREAARAQGVADILQHHAKHDCWHNKNHKSRKTLVSLQFLILFSGNLGKIVPLEDDIALQNCLKLSLGYLTLMLIQLLSLQIKFINEIKPTVQYSIYYAHC
jgi:hypothetical protein